jgi:cystathionine beta-lyase/cystathionine gamma-synthase
MKKTSTLLVHPPKPTPIGKNQPTISPIYQTAKYIIDPNESYSSQFIYSRIRNPTLEELEMTLSTLMGKEETIVLASGIGSISATLLSLLQSGDHVIAFHEMYKPSRCFIRDHLPRFGIQSSFLDLDQVHELSKMILPGKTKLIHFESPSNPNLAIADIQQIIDIAHKHNILVSMDGTFAGPHQHQEFEVDLMVHSLTKYVNGHGDVIAGSISGKKALIHKIRSFTHFYGATLDPHAAFLIQRGLKTYLLRYEKASNTAFKLAHFLNEHSGISKVFYPALVSHPGHELAKKQMKHFGGVLSFELKKGSAEEFCSRLKMIPMAVSLGATETLICPSLHFFGDDLPLDKQKKLGLSPQTLRLSVGLEDELDLIDDLKQALR